MTSRGTKYWDSGTIPLVAPEILGNIIAEVADLAIVFAEDGTVLSVLINPQHQSFSSLTSLEGKDVRSSLATESISKFDMRLASFLSGVQPLRPLELNHVDENGRWEFPIRYSLHRIGPDGAILMLGRDLRPVAEMQQQLVKAQIALERDYESQREFDTRFRVLMDSTREAVLFVSVQSGKIIDANAVAGTLLGKSRENLIGAPFAAELEGRKRGDLIDGLSAESLAEHKSPTKVTLKHNHSVVEIVPTLFRAAGERVLLCRLEPEQDIVTAPDNLTQNLIGLYRHGSDAIVFTLDDGTILTANEGFLDLIETANDTSVKGRSLSDFLSRGTVDLKVLTTSASRSRGGRMRLYPTKVTGEFNSERAVEIAVTSLSADDTTVYAYIIRDASHAEAVRPTGGGAVPDDQVWSMMELVGSATLKDIVAETTNVVEKMCIETAVELTMNNRVAAAEMLGLSRQSLYVKLRKYDLLNKTSE